VLKLYLGYISAISRLYLGYTAQATPQKVLKLADKTSIAVACGASHCVAVTDDGTCYTWGNGDYGKLGHRTQDASWVPKELPEWRAREVSSGL